MKIYNLVLSVIALAIMPVIACAGEPLAQVDIEGGLCPMVGECHIIFIIQYDGRISYNEGTYKAAIKKDVLPPQIVQKLASKIKAADFAAIKNNPFKGTCPTAADGQEFTYQFRISEKTEIISSCKYNIDQTDEPFKTVLQIMHKYE